jgi:hypothetical protein
LITLPSSIIKSTTVALVGKMMGTGGTELA